MKLPEIYKARTGLERFIAKAKSAYQKGFKWKYSPLPKEEEVLGIGAMVVVPGEGLELKLKQNKQ